MLVIIELNLNCLNHLCDLYVVGIEDTEMASNFIADRPFIYIIRDNESKMILFIGRYVWPIFR